MGAARPVATVACAVLPAGIDSTRAWRLAEGLRETALAWGAPLVGGDLATMPSSVAGAPIVVSVTILAIGTIAGARRARRAAA